MKYVQLSQSVLSAMPRPYNVKFLNAALDNIKALNLEIYVTYYETKPNGASFGTGVFQIEADGSLTLICSDFDSSD